MEIIDNLQPKTAEKNMLWQDRPQKIQDAINTLFDSFKEYPVSQWGLNSEKLYNMCYLDDYKFITKIVESSPEQNRFTFVDMGAGDYSWINGLSSFIQNDEALATKKFDIYGLNAEGSASTEIHENVNLHFYGGFKSEDLITSFSEKGHDLNGNVDLFLSRFSLRHMVDPIGITEQAFSLVKKNGFLLVDDFRVNYKDMVGDLIPNSKHSIFEVMTHFDADLLICPSNIAFRSVNHFLLQKHGDNSHIPLKYSDIIHDATIRNSCEYAIEYQYTNEPREVRISLDCHFGQEDSSLWNSNMFSGNKELYDWLEVNELFIANSETFKYFSQEYCGPIQMKDVALFQNSALKSQGTSEAGIDVIATSPTNVLLFLPNISSENHTEHGL